MLDDDSVTVDVAGVEDSMAMLIEGNITWLLFT